MGSHLNVRPARGVTVRDPASGRALSPDGEKVPATTYWRRRLRDGDVELVEERAEAGASNERATPPANTEEPARPPRSRK